MDDALDKKKMPEGKDWQSIAPDIISRLTPKQIREILTYLVTEAGPGEINSFYEGLAKTAGGERATKMIQSAKYGKYTGFKKTA